MLEGPALRFDCSRDRLVGRFPAHFHARGLEHGKDVQVLIRTNVLGGEDQGTVFPPPAGRLSGEMIPAPGFIRPRGKENPALQVFDGDGVAGVDDLPQELVRVGVSGDGVLEGEGNLESPGAGIGHGDVPAQFHLFGLAYFQGGRDRVQAMGGERVGVIPGQGNQIPSVGSLFVPLVLVDDVGLRVPVIHLPVRDLFAVDDFGHRYIADGRGLIG